MRERDTWLRFHFAAALARRCATHLAEDGRAKLTSRTADVLSKARPWARDFPLPAFWTDNSKVGYVPCFVPVVGTPLPHSCRVVASDEFCSYLFGKKAVCDNDIVRRFGVLLEACFPKYETVLGKLYPAHQRLQNCGQNADLAFVHAAWRYSAVLPPEAFPIGLREWPPLDFFAPVALPPLPGPPGPPPAASSSTSS